MKIHSPVGRYMNHVGHCGALLVVEITMIPEKQLQSVATNLTVKLSTIKSHIIMATIMIMVVIATIVIMPQMMMSIVMLLW
jgi:hypothetical protein